MWTERGAPERCVCAVHARPKKSSGGGEVRPKLFIALALGGSLALSTFGSAAADGHHGGFEDLGRAQWAAPAINMLAQQGLLNGVTPT